MSPTAEFRLNGNVQDRGISYAVLKGSKLKSADPVTYDGRGHGISVVVTYPPSGATVAYSRSRTGPFSFARPLWTNVVDGAETWYAVSAEGFDTVTNMATVTIVPSNVKDGLYYGLAVSTNLTVGFSAPTEWVRAENGRVVLEKAKDASSNGEFYKVRVSDIDESTK